MREIPVLVWSYGSCGLENYCYGRLGFSSFRFFILSRLFTSYAKDITDYIQLYMSIESEQFGKCRFLVKIIVHDGYCHNSFVPPPGKTSCRLP